MTISALPAEVRGSFQEKAPGKTAENTVKHRDGGVGSVVANHSDGGESSVVVTTLVSRMRKETRQNVGGLLHRLSQNGWPMHSTTLEFIRSTCN